MRVTSEFSHVSELSSQKWGYHVIKKWECDREMRENSEKSDFFIESYVKKNHMLMKSNSTRVMRSMITLEMSLFDTKLRVHRKYAMWTYALYIHMC